MKLLIALILIISNILVNYSNQHPNNNPEDIIRSYYNYITKDKNADKAMNLISKSSYEPLGYNKQEAKKILNDFIGLLDNDYKTFGRKIYIDRIEILDKSSETMHVKIKQKTVTDDETKFSEEEIFLIKEDNVWKIVLPKEFFTSLSNK